MTDDTCDVADDNTSPSAMLDGDTPNRLGGFGWSGSAHLPSKRGVAIGIVALLVVLAGCGGGSTDGPRTSSRSTDAPTPTVETGPGTETATAPATATPRTTGDSEATTGSTTDDVGVTTALTTDDSARNLTTGDTVGTSTAVASAMVDNPPGATGLDVVVAPRAANSSDVGVRIYAAMGAESATDGIENVTVDAGEGLNVSSVSVFDVTTAGIDDGSTHPGDRTDGPGFGSNVEGGIRSTDDGEGFVVPLDGNRSVGPDDEIVVVIDGGVATTDPGTYTFSLAVNNASAQADSYNVTGT